MMAIQFVPLTLDLLDEGEFVSDAETELATLQETLLRFCRTYKEKAKGAKAELNIKLSLVCEDAERGFFSTKSKMTTVIPSRPSRVSTALAGEAQDGTDCLLVQASGSNRDDPRQMKFSTRDGRDVDPKTGKVKG